VRRPFLPSEVAALESVARLLDDDARAARSRRDRELRDGAWSDSRLVDRANQLSAEAATLRLIARRGEP